VFAWVRQIPFGRVCAYGDLGAVLEPPLSGYFVGRILAACPDEVPWWRVVARDGRLPVWKKDPRLEEVQRERLASEGIETVEDRVDMRRFGWIPDAAPII